MEEHAEDYSLDQISHYQLYQAELNTQGALNEILDL
jgi:hypothetical protein